MNAVMNEPGGTAAAWRIPDVGYEMAGKTGTAQVRIYTKEEHERGVTKNAHLDWKLRDHGLFIGFAPASNPKYAIVCVIEHGATTAHIQVQMARDILLFTQKRDPARMLTAYPLKAAALQRPQRREADDESTALMVRARGDRARYGCASEGGSQSRTNCSRSIGGWCCSSSSSPAPVSRCFIPWRAAVSSPGRCPRSSNSSSVAASVSRGRADRYPRLDEPRLSGLWRSRCCCWWRWSSPAMSGSAPSAGSCSVRWNCSRPNS